MKNSRRKMEELLWITGLHKSARAFYSATFGRQAAAARRKMKLFYSELLKPDALVFDVGANVGVLSAVFASLGARVLALEPNPDCVRHIQLSYAKEKIEIIQAAIGAQNGLALLNISDERDVRSTVSDDWMAKMEGQDESYRGIWARQKVVPMLTLDTLIAHFGKPYFIKIDVEGFEEKVLAGLSVQAPLISFEYTAAYPAPALRCLDLKLFREGSTYNFAYNADWGYPVRFEKSSWMGKEAFKQYLSSIQGGDGQGDIFVRAPE